MGYTPGFDKYVMFDKFGDEDPDDPAVKMRRELRERGPGLQNSGYLDDVQPPSQDTPSAAAARASTPSEQETSVAATRTSAIQAAREHLSTRPEPKKPGTLQRILAAAAGAGGGYLSTRYGTDPELGQRAVEGILYPGYRDKLGRWGAKQQELERAATLEQKQQEDEMRQSEHKAQLGSYEASTAAAKAREALYQRQMNMPSKPAAQPNNYEEHLTWMLRDPNTSDEEKAEIEKKLQDLHAKSSGANPEEREFEALTKRLIDAGEATNEADAKKKAAQIMVKTARTRSVHSVSPLTGSTLQYRNDQDHARDLAGEALDLSNNDKANAKSELQRLRRERNIPYRIYKLALKEIGEPPRQSGNAKGVEALRSVLGLGGGTNGTNGTNGTSQAKKDPLGVR